MLKINHAIKPRSIKRGLENLLRYPGEGLYQRTVRSGVWAFALRIFERGFGIAGLIILARILVPNDFGLMGIALLTMTALETFSQTGFNQALIQKKEKTEEYLDAAWTFSALRSIVLFAILFFAAPYAAAFFDTPRATLIIRITGLLLLLGGPMGIGGFANIGVLYFQKELEFKKQFIYRLTSTLATFATAVSAAIILKSVWALVFGLLAGSFVSFFVSYLIHPYRPHLNFDLGKAKELFGFGKWILGSSILIFLLAQGDDIFVGKFLGATLLGFYLIAYRISNAPATEITHVISQVTFPAYSKLQDNPSGLREAYLKTLQLTAFISIPIAGGIFILAPEFTKIFLGEKWMPMVPAMQVLCILGALRSIAAASGPIFHALGRPDIVTKLSFAQLIFLATIIYPLTIKMGITGTAISVAIVSCTFFHFILYVLFKSVKMKQNEISRFIKYLLFPVAGTMGIWVLNVLIKSFTRYDILIFLITIIVGILIYVAVIYYIDKHLSYGIRSALKNILIAMVSA